MQLHCERLGCEMWEVEDRLKQEQEEDSDEEEKLEEVEEKKQGAEEDEEEEEDSDDAELEALYGRNNNAKVEIPQ